MEMKLKEQLNGIQHVGIPTNDIEKTIRFYVHIAKLIGRVCEAKRPHSVSERPARALS